MVWAGSGSVEVCVFSSWCVLQFLLSHVVLFLGGLVLVSITVVSYEIFCSCVAMGAIIRYFCYLSTTSEDVFSPHVLVRRSLCRLPGGKYHTSPSICSVMC